MRLFVTAAAVLLFGCSESSPSSEPDVCRDLASECRSRQQVCAVSDGTPTCQACPAGEYAASSTSCAPISGTLQSHDFGSQHLDPGQEINGLCQSWTLNNDQELWVNAVEFTSGGAYHHSNWLFVPEDRFDGPDGAWDCGDRGYSELEAALAGGVLFAQSTQATHEVQKFPNGVAVRIPPRSRIIGGTHLLNTSADPIESPLELRIYSIAVSELEVPLAPFRLTYYELTIPANSVSEFTAECDFDSPYQASEAQPWDMDLYYVLPHYHALGSAFRLEHYGGDRDGQVIFEIGGFDAEPHGRAFDPPIPMNGSQGFRFTCGYDNPRPKSVGWGVGDQEMCVMLGFARSALGYDASVQTSELVGESAGTVHYSGTCGVLGFPCAQDKPGG